MYPLTIISDFNTANLAGLLNNDGSLPAVKVVEAPFGQALQILADPSHPVWMSKAPFVLVWTQPQRVISAFERALSNPAQTDQQAVLAEVDQFAGFITSCRNRSRCILVPTWTLPSWERTNRLLDMRPGIGLGYLLSRMNQRLAEKFAGGVSNIYLLDAERWVRAGGARAFSPKAWYLGKTPFSNDVFKQAVLDIKSAAGSLLGASRKLLILDLDDTLWGGTVGDVGWENLILGGHDPEGEALVDFQKALKSLAGRGVLLGVVSKNQESVALEAMSQHPEMVLRPADLAGYRINWSDKAANIMDLANDLNLGLQSVVFVDDNPVERDRVREALPEVLVPEWPSDKTLYRKALLELSCFELSALTSEDTQRSQLYQLDRQRKQSLASGQSLEDWLATLRIRVDVEELGPANLARAVQLLNKTNQMNLATRRLQSAELLEWAGLPGCCVWTFRVADKFGELGLTGLLSLRLDGNTRRAEITDFLLSCRVMGRKVEETMLAVAAHFARTQGASQLLAVHQPTAKNQPCLDFFMRSGFHRLDSSNSFTWDLSNDYAFPPQVEVVWPTLPGSSQPADSEEQGLPLPHGTPFSA